MSFLDAVCGLVTLLELPLECHAVGKQHELTSTETPICHRLSHCVTLGKSLHLSFFIYKMGTFQVQTFPVVTKQEYAPGMLGPLDAQSVVMLR